jgi:mono/diheme cytochrome c family protein
MWPDYFRNSIVAAALLLATGAAAADESSVQLKPGPGLEIVRSACAVCHSLDYIAMNSPFLDSAGWTKTVDKMRRVFGAPLSEEDAAKVVDYLAQQYGKVP